ncbi:MAG: hypothetical protein VYB54_07570 [Pseudomonadota bacterium]|nr:hypothetical protein [Pseudomonadota bacterium]
MRLGLGLGLTSPGVTGGRRPYTVGAKSYDGTNDFASKSGANGANSKQFTFVCALNFSAPGTGLQWLWDVGTSRLAIYKSATTGFVTVEGANSGASNILNIRSNAGIHSLIGAWGVLMISLDMSDANKRHIYLGHTSLGVTATTYTNDTLNLASDYEFATRQGGVNKLAACAAHLWWADGVYTDLSVEANRRKFIDAAGKPISLGNQGQGPTGAQPRVFAPNGDPSTNLGSVGNFTITGALTDCASSPTD